MPEFGLVGKNISYSFSKGYFAEKFKKMNLPYTYENFDLQQISDIKNILSSNPELIGFNVTIPYKEEILPFLNQIDETAKRIGAVNTVKVSRSGELKGYNTDTYGFKKSLKPLLKPNHKTALILGTGGASKAVAHTLKQLNISYDYVSRTANKKSKFLYSDLTEQIIHSYSIIINCTPIGTFPDVNNCPDIPYEGLTENHILYDLVYNPPVTKFLACGEMKGAQVINGSEMLQFQAEKAWHIWNEI
ncbi:shikimate dehydrogenase [Flavobacteriaceae bacterium MAR_2010_188]|nr:shikimate dehydrogenase [Flavobacteriaceae bacterium MAR_2010_188]